jgi:hypothetical protein
MSRLEVKLTMHLLTILVGAKCAPTCLDTATLTAGALR